MTMVLRATAVVIALLALIDPARAVKVTEPVPVDLLLPATSDPGYEAAVAIRRQLEDDLSGLIAARSPEPPRARLSIGGALPPDLSVPLIAFAPEPQPGVTITAARAAEPIIEGQAIQVTAVLRGDGLNGRTSAISLVDRGVAVARAEHTWTTDQGEPEVTLTYAAPSAGLVPLTVRVDTPGAATRVADVPANVGRGPLRALIYEPRPSWAAAFVRRALEGEPRFVVAALSRSAPRVAARLSAAPRSLDALTPGDFDVIVVGAPDQLTPPELTILDRFASVRGGTVLLLPDTRLPARVEETFELPRTEEKLLVTPVRVQSAPAGVQASELLLPTPGGRSHTPIVFVTVDGASRPAIFSTGRGDGAIAVSGLMDAWRYRGGEAQRFWRGLLAELAVQAPAPLSIRLRPALARPGDRVHLTATWRTDFVEAGEVVRVPATAATMIDDTGRRIPLRLWPGDRAGSYEAWIDAPAAGGYDVTAAGAGVEATAALRVDDSVEHPAGLVGRAETVAALTGGGVPRTVEELREGLARLPAPVVERTRRPMRSPWWIVAFAGCLCAEWLVRRRRGLR